MGTGGRSVDRGRTGNVGHLLSRLLCVHLQGAPLRQPVAHEGDVLLQLVDVVWHLRGGGQGVENERQLRHKEASNTILSVTRSVAAGAVTVPVPVPLPVKRSVNRIGRGERGQAPARRVGRGRDLQRLGQAAALPGVLREARAQQVRHGGVDALLPALGPGDRGVTSVTAGVISMTSPSGLLVLLITQLHWLPESTPKIGARDL